MLQINIATLTAPALAPLADLLSLLQTSATAPAASTNSSAQVTPDFSAILTEMIGPVEPQGVEPRKPQEPQKETKVEAVQTVQQPVTSVVIPLVPLTAVATTEERGLKPPTTCAPESESEHVAAAFSRRLDLPPTELQRAFAEVRKIEVTVQQDAVKPETQSEAKPDVRQEPALPALPEIETNPVKPAGLVTTDPIANVQQQELPTRVVAVQKVALEARSSERSKPAQTAASTDTATTPASPATHFAAGETVQHVEQARAAHQVEIPDVPKAQVVRTVSMEVGDADSQVTIRIQERGGDVTLHMNTASGPLHQDLQQSVGSLVHALKQEQVQVSNVEVSRKSPIDRVRRMKEARS